MRHVCLLVILALAAAGCGGGEKNTGHVTWAKIVALVLDCKVKAVGQTHAKRVTITLRDGGTAYAQEPRIDMIGHVANRAYKKCGAITYSTE